MTKIVYMIFVAYLLINLDRIYCFIPKIRVKNMLINKGLYTSIIEKFSIDSLDDSILTEITSNFDVNNEPSLLLTTLLYIGYLTRPNKDKIDKLEKLKEYKKSREISRQFMLFTFVIFMRNVEAAT